MLPHNIKDIADLRRADIDRQIARRVLVNQISTFNAPVRQPARARRDECRVTTFGRRLFSHA